MTPQRKAALEFIHERGAVTREQWSYRDAPSGPLFMRMCNDEQVICTLEGWTLTDKGRRDLHDG